MRAVLTDNARAYDSRAFRAVADAHAVSLERTQPYRPQTNGKAERFIRIPQDARDRSRSVRTACVAAFDRASWGEALEYAAGIEDRSDA